MDIIPVTNEPSSRFNISLEDGDFDVRLNFNGTTATWSMDLSNNGVPIISGLTLVTGTDIVRGYNLNIGSWVMIDLTNSGIDPDINNLGVQLILYYIPESEKQELIDAGIS